MRIIAFIIIIVFGFSSCNSNQNKEYIVDFSSEFFYNASYKIDNGVLYQLDINERYKSKFPKERAVSHRFDSYAFENMQYEIPVGAYKKFLDRMNRLEMDTSIFHTKKVLDGLAFGFYIISPNEDPISLVSVCPVKTAYYNKEYLFLDAFFDMANESVTNEEDLLFLEIIKHNFEYGLPIEPSLDNKFEYHVLSRIWAHATIDHYPELQMLLDTIPKEEHLIFDLRNGSLSDSLLSYLEEQKENISYYGNIDLTEIERKIAKLEKELLSNTDKPIDLERQIVLNASIYDRNAMIDNIRKRLNHYVTKAEIPFSQTNQVSLQRNLLRPDQQ